MQLFTLIPTVFSIIYAVIVKIRGRKYYDATLVIIGGSIALFNAYFMYGFFTGDVVSDSLRCLQQFVSSMIVPIIYMYFALQMGRKWLNGVTVVLWLLVLLIFFPTGIFILDGVTPEVSGRHFAPMTLHFFRQGGEVFSMRSADLLIMLQGIVAVYRVIVLIISMRRYHITFSPRMRYFILWCSCTVLFILFTSLHTTADFGNPLLLWSYYVLYAMLMLSFFILLAFDFDLRPIMHVLEQEDEADDIPVEELDTDEVRLDDAPKQQAPEMREVVVIDGIDSFILQAHAMADRVREMIVQKRYLDSGFTAENLISELGTNRTYFSRMIRAEFGCTFSELVAKYRMEYAVDLLTNSELTIQEIACRSGYPEMSYFSRRFKQIYGCPPSQYRGG